jgi:hypothetical protein
LIEPRSSIFAHLADAPQAGIAPKVVGAEFAVEDQQAIDAAALQFFRRGPAQA